MKPFHAAALALVLLASCGPDLAAIDDANQRAQAAARRSEASAANAEQAAKRVERDAADAEDVGHRANDLMSRVCSVSAAPYGCSADHKKCWPTRDYLRFRKIQAEACQGK